MVLLLVAFTCVARGEEVRLAGKRWEVRVEPGTMRVAGAVGGETITIAAGREGEAVRALKVEETRATWSVGKVDVEARLEGEDEDLLVEVTAKDVGTFAWPGVASPDAGVRAYVVPLFEGSYVPVRDAGFGEFLEKQGAIDTTAGLSMPFWGVQYGSHTITYVLTNAFNNELTFKRDGDGGIGWSLAHEFTRNQAVKRYGVRVHLGGASPSEPALFYRKRVMAEGWFVSMKQKIERTPATGKLLGAAHAYLWGDDVLGREDVLDARGVAKRLGTAEAGSAATRVWEAVGAEEQKHLAALATQEYSSEFDKRQVAAALSAVDDQKLVREAVGDLLRPADECGDGFGPRLIDAMAKAGLDRMWLGSPSWRGLSVRPEAAKRAIEQGYLVAPYDSYHSIHRPGESDTWETAQFDQALYDAGPIVRADGSRRKGFKQKGFILSPIAARPYVERRVTGLLQQFTANAWFMDCDGFGEWFDDYSAAHPATQADDLAARRGRLEWMRDAKGLVVGTEGGSALITPSIAYAHGVMTPVIGWGDPDLTRKDSKFYLGAYYPPDEPGVFFKTVPIKAEYARVYADPAYRLPLYELVFHDSVVATHQWGYGSLKFADESHARELMELLYQVPPLYHLNLHAWRQHEGEIVRHYGFFSPLHRETGTMAMTAFEYVNEARTVQRAVYGEGEVELIGNVGEAAVTVGGVDVPGRSIMARWPKSGRVQMFTPGG